MPSFFVDQNSVKTLAKALRAALGPVVRHKGIIRSICAALGWRDDALMHHLKKIAEAGCPSAPAIVAPAGFSRDLARDLSAAYGRPIFTADIERHFRDAEAIVSMGHAAPSEDIFGFAARKMVANGWSVFPQEISAMRPAVIDGRIIKWAEEHDLANRQPDADVLNRWIERCPSLNVAAVMGPGSSNAFVIDVDVDDADLSRGIQELAVRHFGRSPLRQISFWPKISLVYRQAPDSRIDSARLPFEKTDSSASDESIEVVSAGLPIPMYGRNPKTGQWHKWLDGSPIDIGPSACPAVSSERPQDFLADVNKMRRFVAQ
ncbi:hypothetical protein D3C71_315870 [compost metagenome]